MSKASELDYYELPEDPRAAGGSNKSRQGFGEFFKQCDPREDPIEFINTVALGFLICGIIIVTVAFMIPRDYTFDPELPAAKMEAIEVYYNGLRQRLDITITVGTVFVAVGALLIGGIFTFMLIRGDFIICFKDPDYVEEDQVQFYKDQREYGTEQKDQTIDQRDLNCGPSDRDYSGPGVTDTLREARH